jgi:GNAT superfamily N-acetyltransferase
LVIIRFQYKYILDLVPEDVQKKMPPPYHDLPATLLGRLAVDQHYKGQRLGEYLLMDALRIAFDASEYHIGSMALIAHPLIMMQKHSMPNTILSNWIPAICFCHCKP